MFFWKYAYLIWRTSPETSDGVRNLIVNDFHRSAQSFLFMEFESWAQRSTSSSCPFYSYPLQFRWFNLDLVRSQGCCLKDHHDGKGLGVAGLGNWPPVHLYPSTCLDKYHFLTGALVSAPPAHWLIILNSCSKKLSGRYFLLYKL